MNQNSQELLDVKSLIKNGLLDAGLGKGDVALVHSDVNFIKKISSDSDWKTTLGVITDSFLDVIGTEGTLITPTFTYSFCQGRPYIHERTFSQVGLFSNYILSRKDSIRSFHPIFSFAAIGKQANDICGKVSKSSFGEGSVFHKLHQLNSKILFFNAGFISCTFVHYIEQKKEVDYRFLKKFTGTVRKEGKEFTETVDFYVRYLDREVVTSLNQLERDLVEKNKIRKAFIHNQEYPILIAHSDDVYQMAMNKLELEPYYLLKSHPKPLTV
jgi:aminoglycoside 3-N-acetyltransferase